MKFLPLFNCCWRFKNGENSYAVNRDTCI